MKKIILAVAIVLTLAAAGFIIAQNVSAEETTTETPVTTAGTPSYNYGPGYGMMGGYAGYSGGYVGGCVRRTGTVTTAAPSYEWLYLHLDSDEKLIVDTLHTELLATYDFTAMDAAARLAALGEIRTALADYIVEEGFVDGVNP